MSRADGVAMFRSDTIKFLPRRLAITLQSLAPLPQSFAQAKRIDPLTRLEADLQAVAPFISEYRETHTRCITTPDALSLFLQQSQVMKDIVEEKKYAAMTCRRTDLHETRDVIFRQLLRLFDAALEGSLETQRVATAVPTLEQVVRHTRKSSSMSISLSLSCSKVDDDRTLSKISAILPFSLPLSRSKIRRNTPGAPLDVNIKNHDWEECAEDTKWKLRGFNADAQEDTDAIVIRLQ